MILVDDKGSINLVNQQTEQLFNYRREELIGEQMEMLIPKRFRNVHPGHRKTFYSAPSARTMGAGRDLFALTKHGEEIQVEIGLNPIETEEGDMIPYLYIGYY